MEKIIDHETDQDIESAYAMVVALCGLTMQFARVERITRYPDGRRESDVEHSYMLGLIAPIIAGRFYPDIDPGEVAVMALVHDLVEVYAGDTQTLKIDAKGLENKAELEAAALAKLVETLGPVAPELISWIEIYESQSTPAAKLVKRVDKCLPAPTHLFNEGQVLKDDFGMTSREHFDFDVSQTIERYRSALGSEFPEVLALRLLLHEKLIETLYPD